MFSEEWVSCQVASPGGATLESQRKLFAELAPALLVDVDVDSLRAIVDPRFHDLLDGLEPSPGVVWSIRTDANFGDRTTPVDLLAFRLHDDQGERVGGCTIG
jgi:hypothetical protein